jgi:hypothetical protein
MINITNDDAIVALDRWFGNQLWRASGVANSDMVNEMQAAISAAVASAQARSTQSESCKHDVPFRYQCDSCETEKSVTLTADTQARVLENFGPGKVTMYRCGVCGWLEWISTSRAAPDSVEVQSGGNSRCAKCLAIHHHTPDLYEWVTGVVATAAYRHSASLHDHV